MTGESIGRRGFLHGTDAAGTAAVTGIGAATPAQAAAEFHDPITGNPIGDDRGEHIACGSLCGIDHDMPVRTRPPTSGSGVVTGIPFNGTGGHTVGIRHDNGYRTRHTRLSKPPTG